MSNSLLAPIRPAKDASVPNSQRKRIFIPLGAKLTVPIVILTALVAWGAYLGLVNTSRANLLKSKVAAADMVIKLFAASATPAIVFNDETEMQRSVNDLSKNPEVTDVELWAVPEEGEPAATKPLALFHRHGGALKQPDNVIPSQHISDLNLDVVEPIVDNDKKVVAVALARFSLRREHEVLAALANRTLLVAAGVGMGLSLALVLMLAQIVVVPLGRLKAAAKGLQNGTGSDQSILPRGGFEDEVGQLATVFVTMAEAVADREARLASRNTELRLILDNVAQGFVTVTADGSVQKERSAIVDRWFPQLGDGARFGNLIALMDPKQQDMAELGWSQLDSGFLPLDLCIDQLPKLATRDLQHFSIEYQPVMDGELISRMVVVISDISSEVERHRVEEDQKEFAALVDRLVRDRHGFLEFWGELERLMARLLRGGAYPQLRRDLHTAKGNSRFYGMWRLSQGCHKLEDALLERSATELNEQEIDLLNREWVGIKDRVEALTKGASAFLELSESDYDRLGHALRERLSHELLAGVVSEFHYEPTRRRLDRARDIIENTCRRTGKPVAQVTIEDNALRLPPERWTAFWATFTHLLTNAVEHGIESGEERLRTGKSECGSLRLTTRLAKSEFVIEVADDGRGIDWDAVAEKAKSRGLPHATSRDLERALLSEGFSMKQQASDIAGRGVGMSAVSHAVGGLGGEIHVDSAIGRGTTWRLQFPLATTHTPPRESLLPPSSQSM